MDLTDVVKAVHWQEGNQDKVAVDVKITVEATLIL